VTPAVPRPPPWPPSRRGAPCQLRRCRVGPAHAAAAHPGKGPCGPLGCSVPGVLATRPQPHRHVSPATCTGAFCGTSQGVRRRGRRRRRRLRAALGAREGGPSARTVGAQAQAVSSACDATLVPGRGLVNTSRVAAGDKEPQARIPAPCLTKFDPYWLHSCGEVQQLHQAQALAQPALCPLAHRRLVPSLGQPARSAAPPRSAAAQRRRAAPHDRERSLLFDATPPPVRPFPPGSLFPPPRAPSGCLRECLRHPLWAPRPAGPPSQSVARARHRRRRAPLPALRPALPQAKPFVL
jgi:hypothetical protein